MYDELIDSDVLENEVIMPSSLRPNRLNIDLQGYKQPWLEYCTALGTTPSEAFRQVVAKLIANGTPVKPLTEYENERDGTVRKEIRLTRSELARAEALAQAGGFSVTRWILALLRARLDASPQLGQQELEMLARSNLQILSIGRTLNQIAKAITANPNSAAAISTELIDRTRTELMGHARVVADVLAANMRRWR